MHARACAAAGCARVPGVSVRDGRAGGPAARRRLHQSSTPTRAGWQAPMSESWSGVSASARSVGGGRSLAQPAEGDPVSYDPVDETFEEAKPRLLASKVWR
eukprot:COSAG02_NODE_1096_length_14601_cov_185.142946_5_plen_101_part_00